MVVLASLLGTTGYIDIITINALVLGQAYKQNRYLPRKRSDVTELLLNTMQTNRQFIFSCGIIYAKRISLRYLSRVFNKT